MSIEHALRLDRHNKSDCNGQLISNHELSAFPEIYCAKCWDWIDASDTITDAVLRSSEAMAAAHVLETWTVTHQANHEARPSAVCPLCNGDFERRFNS